MEWLRIVIILSNPSLITPLETPRFKALCATPPAEVCFYIDFTSRLNFVILFDFVFKIYM